MRQLLQDLRTGKLIVDDVPVPANRGGQGLIRSRVSLISAGTEKMLVGFARAGWLEKARQQPDKVRQVLDKIFTDGIMATTEAVRSRLETPLPLGYCNLGELMDPVDESFLADGLKPGMRVVSNGPHADIVRVPRLLCAAVPSNVSDEAAVFAVLGAVALQGIRLVAPTVGETVAVFGLGIVGLLASQILMANGCRVLAIDTDATRCDLAKTFGAATVCLSNGGDPLIAAQQMTRGRGVDAVILAAATKSSQPLHQAAQISRPRGRIVLVGVTGLELRRSDFFEKELTFQVSCSYGPGRYDPQYEEKGHDYPFGLVRWTEQRNIEAVLQLMADGKIDPLPLISHRFPIDKAVGAYDLIAGQQEPYLGILLEYDADRANTERCIAICPVAGTIAHATHQAPRVGVIGAGVFTARVLLPALQRAGARLMTIVSDTGLSGTQLAKKFAIASSTTDPDNVFSDPAIDIVAIATRHDSHADLIVRALSTGKHVFCEKPLCLSMDQLNRILATIEGLGPGAPLLMVGFNRRFAPLVARMKQIMSTADAPKTVVVTVNAGEVPTGHWTRDTTSGGGRIIGEVCHFIDLIRFIVGAPIVDYRIAHTGMASEDCATIQLAFADGSSGTVHYLTNGHRSFPKERIEVFGAGRIAQIDNFRTLRAFGIKGRCRWRCWRQDKGHLGELTALVGAVERGGAAPIPLPEIIEVTRVSLALSAAAGGTGER